MYFYEKVEINTTSEKSLQGTQEKSEEEAEKHVEYHIQWSVDYFQKLAIKVYCFIFTNENLRRKYKC